MKNLKIVLLLIIVTGNFSNVVAQISLAYPERTQGLSQYTSVFICSPNSGTKIQLVHDDVDQDLWFNSDRFYEYNNGYVQLTQDPAPGMEDTMVPGKGYVLQLGGRGNIANPGPATDQVFNFGTSGANNGPISVAVTNNQFNLLGNPYSDFLDRKCKNTSCHQAITLDFIS